MFSENKVYFLKRRWDSKFYRSEKALLKEINENVSGEIYVFELASKSDASEFYNNLIKKRQRNEQLSIVLGDSPDIEAVSNFKNMLENLGVNKSRDYDIIMRSLKKLGCNKATFKSFVNNWRLKSYILSVSNSVEWFECVLKCHNFQALGSPRELERLSEETKENFKKAKLLIKNKK